MSHSLNQKQADLLKECLTLAQDLDRHADVDRQFLDLTEILADKAEAIAVLEAVWKELLLARRSSAFWQQISDVERTMSEKLADNNIQLQQNYLRLMQEQ